MIVVVVYSLAIFSVLVEFCVPSENPRGVYCPH